MERQQDVKKHQADKQSEAQCAAQPCSSQQAPAHPLLELQRTVGNRALGRILQAKLRISKPGDVYEREADRVAHRVLRMPEPAEQQQRADPSDRDGGHAEGRRAVGVEHHLQASRAHVDENAEAEVPSIVHEVLNSDGQSLDMATRSFFESRFGHDLSHIRVHTDAQAAESARAVNARAYTVGRDVVFDSGQYAPGTEAGRHLLAHELTHTMQQQAAGPMVQLAPNETTLDVLADEPLEERPWSPTPHEATTIGSAGEKMDVEDLKSRLLEQGYDEVYAKEEFGRTARSKWLTQAFPDKRKRPDVVAINNKTREILVVDVTASPSSTAKSSPGDLKQLPVEWETRERQRFKGNRYRSADVGDEMKPSTFEEHPVQAYESESKLHIEKTVEDARQLARSLKGEREQYKVKAMDVHWRTGTQTKQILVKPAAQAPSSGTPGGTTPSPSEGEATKLSAPVATEAVTASPPRAPQVTSPPASSLQTPAPTAPPIAAPEPTPTAPTPAPPTQEKAPTPVTPPHSPAETTATKAPTETEPRSPVLSRPTSAEPEARQVTPAPPSLREAAAPPSKVTRNLSTYATRGEGPASAPRQFNLAPEGTHAAGRPVRVVSETELPGPRGMGLQGGPSPLVAPMVGLAANVGGALLTSWMHDKILESVANMPQPIINQVELWKESGMHGRNALDLLASDIGKTRAQFQENRGRLSLSVLYFWTQLDRMETAERFAALDSLEDSIMQDTAQLLTGQSNIAMALELEPRIQQSIEAAAELQSYIKSPLGTPALFYGVGMGVEEIMRISDNLAWYQSAYRAMLRSLHELSAEVERQIAANDALREQIGVARRHGGRAPR